MKYKDIDKVMEIVRILQSNFDGKITNFPEIRTTINKTKYKTMKNNVIRQILFYLERINVVKIQKGLSGHLTIYNDIVIEDYKFNFDGVYDYVYKKFEEKFAHHINNNELQVMICDGKVIYSPLDNIDAMTSCTSPNVVFTSVTTNEIQDAIRSFDVFLLIENLLTSSVEDIIDKAVLKIVGGENREVNGGWSNNRTNKNKHKRSNKSKRKKHRQR